jgi:uncharacterized protein
MASVLEPQVAARSIDWRRRLALLVVQPTPFCNLDCSYCYLPDRANRALMAQTTLAVLLRKVFAAELPAAELSVVWHAGEPLTVPRAWYVEAFAAIERLRTPGVDVTHHFQTNGVLIDAAWCDFFRAYPTRVGVSIDGPASLHDRTRKTRDGRGTHARVMRGIDVLKTQSIPFHVICVLTRESLDHADVLFDFFAQLGCTELCFNVEEIEAGNATSTLSAPDAEVAFRRFFARIVERWQAAPTMRIREIDGVLGALRDSRFGTHAGNAQNEPGAMLNVGYDGTFTTYSPELLGQSHHELGSLNLGNVLRDDLVPRAGNVAFDRIDTQIRAGVRRCRDECKYFDFCLGGAPANKLAESGTFASTQTMYCRLTQQAVTDCVLAALETDLRGAAPVT